MVRLLMFRFRLFPGYDRLRFRKRRQNIHFNGWCRQRILRSRVQFPPGMQIPVAQWVEHIRTVAACSPVNNLGRVRIETNVMGNGEYEERNSCG